MKNSSIITEKDRDIYFAHSDHVSYYQREICGRLEQLDFDAREHTAYGKIQQNMGFSGAKRYFYVLNLGSCRRHL